MKKKKIIRGKISLWCDLTCPSARRPTETGIDGAGSCRTFAALYCARLKRYVPKHAPCAAGR